MDLARVIGRVVCTVKDPSLTATKLLIVQPIDTTGRALGEPLIAIDAVGAGAGETVFFVTGREASFAFLPDTVVADVSVVGIVDTVSTDPDFAAARARHGPAPTDGETPAGNAGPAPTDGDAPAGDAAREPVRPAPEPSP